MSKALSLAALACFVACSPGSRDADTELEPVPQAAVKGSEELVRLQLAEARQALEAAVAHRSSAEELAATFGATGLLFHSYDLLEPAAACYRNAHRLMPSDYRWLYYLGSIYQRRGRFEEAAQVLQAALELQPQDPALLLRLGQTDLARGKSGAAQRRFSAALATEPACHAARFGLGQAAAAVGKDASAAEHFRRTLAKQPEALQVHYPLAQILLRLGRHQEARVHLERATSRAVSVGGRPTCPDPLDAQLAELESGAVAHLRRALMAANAGNNEREIAGYRKAVEIAPDDPVARQSLGSVLLRAGKVGEAYLQYAEAVRLRPRDPNLHSDLGVIAVRLGNLDEAERHLRRALDLLPESTYFQLQVASVVQRLGGCAEAVELHDRILVAEPWNRQARLQRALCLARLGRSDEAAQELGGMIDLEPPEDPSERLQLASLFLSVGDLKRALRHSEAVLVLEAPAGIKARAHLLIGQVRLRRGDRAGAAESFGAAAKLDPIEALRYE